MTEEQKTVVEETVEKTFTQADLDKIVSERIKSEQNKWQKKIEEQAQKQKEEMELAKMNELEKANALSKKNEELAKQYKSELDALQQKAQTIDILKEKGLDIGFADILMVKGDNEKTLANIDAFKTTYDNAVKQGIENAVKTNVPKANVNTPEQDDYLAGFDNGIN